MRTSLFWQLLSALTIFLVLCGAQGCASQMQSEAREQSHVRAPRNIILVIGDGMGPQQLAFAELYYQRTKDERAAALVRFMQTATQGVQIPSPATSLVNDSACAASQLAGGCRCEPRRVGVDASGERCASAAFQSKQRGRKVGLVSDTRITHATPAAFAAMVPDRDMEHEIASQLVGSGFDLLFSGGEALFVPDASKCRGKRCSGRDVHKYFRPDGRNLVTEAQRIGMQFVSNGDELSACQRTPVLGLFSPLFMHDAFREQQDGEPSLSRMTERALELLDNPAGFFLMVESGQIDFAAHANDAGWVLREMLRLSASLAAIERFVKGRDDTLVVLTADHETGGMGLSYRKIVARHAEKEQAHTLDFLDAKTFSILISQRQSVSEALKECQLGSESEARMCDTDQLAYKLFGERSEALALDMKRELEVRYGRELGQSNDHFDQGFYPYESLAKAARLGRAIGASAGVIWGTGTHTTTPVFVLAKGPGHERFAGWQHARDVGRTLLDLAR